MTVHRRANVAVTLTVRPYTGNSPEDATIVYRFASGARSDPDTHTQGRVVNYDDIARAVSSLDGEYEVPTWGLTLDDNDGLLRGLLADPETGLVDEGRWEIEATIISDEGRVLAIEEGRLFRGIVTDAIPEGQRDFRIEAKSICGGHMKGFDLDGLTLQPKLVDYFGTLDGFPENNKEKHANLVYGEASDHGTVDVAGNTAEKGLVPVDYVGKTLISDGYPGTPPTSPVYLEPPSNLQCVVTGSGPEHSVAIGVALTTHFGETTPTVIVVPDYPVTPSPSHYATWTWDLPVTNADQIVHAVEYVGDRMAYPKYFLDGDGGSGGPATSYVDDGDDSHTKGYRHGPLKVNTAQVAPGAPGIPGSGPMFWDTYIAAVGVLPWHEDYVDVFASDLAVNSEATRVKLTEAERRQSFITPLDDEWPHDDPWIEQDGVRFAGFYGRGVRSQHHIDGKVGICLNIPGYTDEPDGSGDVFDQAGPCLLHLLTNWFGLDVTTPTYTNGATWNDYPRFANTDSKLDVESFETFQDDSADAMANVDGPKFRHVFTEPMGLRDVMRHASRSFYLRWRDNHFGQLGVCRNPHGLSGTGTLYQDRIQIKRWHSPTFDRDVANEVTWVYDYDSELQEYRRTPQTITADVKVAANDGKPKPREVIEMRFTGDPATATVSAHYWLALYKQPRRFQPFEVGLLGLARDLDNPLMATHYDGLGQTGEVETQMVLDRHVVALSRETVVFTALDVSRFAVPTIPGLSPLGDEDEMGIGNLGDEESAEAPPEGAYELVDENA